MLKREHETVNFGGVWHTDTSYQKLPPMATMLQAIELPPIGGDTLFANQEMAYERLSDGLKETLGGLRVICAAGKAKVAATRTARIEESGKSVDIDELVAKPSGDSHASRDRPPVALCQPGTCGAVRRLDRGGKRRPAGLPVPASDRAGVPVPAVMGRRRHRHLGQPKRASLSR